MSQEKTIAAMRLVGGNPCLDFVNTVDSRRERWGPDLLQSYADLVEWAGRVNVIDDENGARLRSAAVSNPQAAEEALSRAKAVREALHGVLQAEAAAQEAPQADIQTLAEAVSRAGSCRSLNHSEGSFLWAWNDDRDLNAIANRIAFEAAELLVSRNERRAVRECLGPNCGWLFIDTSRGGHRRWCADATCGSHMRVRRFRKKPDQRGA